MSMTETELLKQQIDNLKEQITLLESGKEQAQTIDNPMSRLILLGLEKISDDSGPIVGMYRKLWGFANYAVICGIGGTLVNYLVLSSLISILPLIIADIFAILVAAFWNYTLTVGSLGHLSGLAPKGKKKNGDWI